MGVAETNSLGLLAKIRWTKPAMTFIRFWPTMASKFSAKTSALPTSRAAGVSPTE